MGSGDHAEVVRRLGAEAGFARVGIARVEPLGRAEYVRAWLARGRAGEMAYLERTREIRLDPEKLLAGARSVIVAADLYHQKLADPPADRGGPSPGDGPARGRVAQYAWGRDYHRVLRKKLHRFADALREAIREPFDARVCVDTAPVLEREWAAAAGIGWIGKNTMVLHQDLGSFFFLGEIVTTLELPPSSPAADHCGTCTRCLDACPTAAFVAPYQMDATRCIAYLTIEHRGAVAETLQPLMGDWVFGCDVCQDVCPYNREAPVSQESSYFLNQRNPLPPRPALDGILKLTEADHREQLAGSAMKRATLPMLQRNAAIAMRNQDAGQDRDPAGSDASRPSC